MARRLAIAILALLLAAVVALGWWLAQPSSLRWAVERAVQAGGGQLQVQEVDGSLLSGVRIGLLRWRGDPARPGVEVELRELRADWRLLSLLRRELDLTALTARSVRIALAASDEPAALPASLVLPLGLRLRALRVDELVVVPAGEGEPIVLKAVELEARYAGGEYRVSRLEGETPWGRARIEGRLRDREPYEAALDAQATLAAAPLSVPVELRAQARGPLAGLDVDATAQAGEGGSARIRGRVLPFGTPAFGALALELENVDLAALGLLEGRATRLAGRVELAPVGASQAAPSGQAPPVPSQPRSPQPAPPQPQPSQPRSPQPQPSQPQPSQSQSQPQPQPQPQPQSGASPLAQPPAQPPAALALAGRIEFGNALAGPLDRGALPVTALRSGLRWSAAEGLALDGADLELAGGGRIRGDARLDPSRTVTLPGLSMPWLAFDLQVAGLDLAALHGGLPRSALRGRADGDGQRFDVDLGDAARNGVSLQARGRIDEARLELERALLAGGEGFGGLRLSAAGRVGVRAPHELALEGEFERLDPARLLALGGAAAPAATPRSGRTSAPARAAQTPGAPGTAAGAPSPGAPSSGAEPAGDSPLAQLHGALDGRWSLRGQLPATPSSADAAGLQLRLEIARGELAGMPVRAQLSTRLLGVAVEGLSPERLRVRGAVADASLGGTRLSARGDLGAAGDRLDFQLRAPSLAPLAGLLGQPGLAGTLQADGALRGAIAEPALSLRAQGAKLALGESARVGSLSLDLDLPSPARGLFESPFTLALQARDLASGALELRSLRIDGDGSARAHTLRASLAGARAGLRLAASGALAEGWKWSGLLRELEASGEVPARLTGPVEIEAAPGPAGPQLRIGAAAIEGDFGAIRLQRGSWREGRIELALDARLSRLGWIVTALGLTGGVDGASEALDPLTLELHADLAGSSVADVSGTLAARLDGPADAVGRGSADLRLSAGALSGPLELAMPTLAFANRLIGPEWAVDGRLRFAGRVSGTLEAPRLVGELAGSGLRLQQHAMGWRMRDGSLSGRFDGERFRLDSMKLFAGPQDSPGSVELRGEVRVADLEGRFDLVAERFGVLIGPGQRVVVSGRAQASSSAGTFRLEGKLRADEGRIELAGGDAPSLPPDVVVLSRQEDGSKAPPAAPASRASLQIASDVELDLGDQLRVQGSGLDARLAGSIRLTGSLPAAPRAQGTVRIRDGRFRAYGQELAITRGQIVFNGPLDNPVLDIVALRRNQQVEAGVAVTGTVLSPQIRLTSRPEVPDAEKLSWLVLGVPLENAQSAGQGAALQVAAATLFGSNDGGLASALGVDVLTIRGSSRGGEDLLSSRFGGGGLGSALPPVPGQVGSTGSVAYGGTADSVVAVGKRLSSRLFVTYEQGLRGVWNLLLIQYDITRRLSLRAQTGSESAIDLLYRYSFD